MADVSFSDFTPRSFEQFAQSLSAAVIGPGLLVFGDGADGGREASYEGKVPFPNVAAPWSGKLVMQAKFLQRPAGDGKDATWLVEQLRREAKRYGEGSRTVPDHYILVTNIRLSGVDGGERKGGQRKIQEAFEKHLRPLGVRDFDVWHEEKIATLLDLHPDLYRSYGAWLGGREALAAVYRSFEAKVPNFRATMLLYLQRELRAQRSTRLQQAGHVGEGATPLESVFVDLPYSVEMRALDAHFGLTGAVGAGDGPSGLARTLLGGFSLKADPSTLDATWSSADGPPPNRYLILGGPGQGKSTITQFLGQVMRFRLLREESATLLSSDTVATLASIKTRLAELGLPVHGLRRYPIRVELPLYADAWSVEAANDRRLSLLAYVARSMAAVTDTPSIDVAILRDWLGSYPFLIMLDGLDEVPPSGARREVIAAIVDFWDEVGPRDADVIMTVTTRPQGYNDDLDPKLYTRLEMARLTAEQALAYAERVAMLKLPDVDRQTLVLSRLAEAARNTATATLMISPLQVAILFQLVDQRGTAPTDRWTLFDEYLSVVMKREQEKAGPGGAIVRAHETLIRRLLRRVGLLLHVEAELGGAADAFLARERLEAIAADLLDEEGYEADELRELAAGIVTAATDRLVFLEQRTEGRIEFDVRSLQEFMAAAELMTGGDAEVRARLREVAGRTHWQHVYRIAASKAFSAPDAVKYRDSVLAINRELDDDGPAARALRRGAARSLDLVADGLAAGQPKFRRLLASHALELLAMTFGIPDRRLTDMVRGMGEGYARDALAQLLGSANRLERRSGWGLLLGCIDARGGWADALATTWWPEDPAARLDAISCGVLPPLGTLAADRLEASLQDVVPEELHDLCETRQTEGARDVLGELARRFPFLRPLADRMTIQTIDVEFLPTTSADLSLQLVPVAGQGMEPFYAAPAGQTWAPYGAVHAFTCAPSLEAAAAFAGVLSDPVAASLARDMQLPWPLLNLSTIIAAGSDPGEVAAATLAGEFGDVDAWTDAEERLTEHGMSITDLDRWCEGVLLNGNIADVGMPYPNRMSLSRSGAAGGDWLPPLKRAALEATPGPARNLMKRIISFSLSEAGTTFTFLGGEYMRLFGDYATTSRLLDPSVLAWVNALDLADPTLLDFLGDAGEAAAFLIPDSPREAGRLVQQILAGSEREGALVLALALVAGTGAGAGVAELARNVEARIAGKPANTPAGRDTFAALRLVTGAEEVDFSDLVSSPGDSVGQHALLAFAKDAVASRPAIKEALAFLATSVTDADHVRAEALRILSGALDQDQSELHRAERWRELSLPGTLYARLVERRTEMSSGA